MSKDLETIYFFIVCTSFFGVWFPNLLYSPIHGYLRDKRNYTAIFLIAVLLLIISIYIIEPSWEKHEKSNALSPIILISYLLLYKIANKISQMKYNRDMNFSCRISKWIGKEEAEQSTILESIIQLAMLIIAMLIWGYIGKILFGTEFL